MLGQILKFLKFVILYFFLHFNLAYHTYKAPYNKSLRQAHIRWLWPPLVTCPFNWHHAITFTFDLLQGQIYCCVGDHNSANLLVKVRMNPFSKPKPLDCYPPCNTWTAIEGKSNAAVRVWLGKWVRVSKRPSVRLCLNGTIQTTVFDWSLSNFTRKLFMMRGGTLLIFGYAVKGQGKIWQCL